MVAQEMLPGSVARSQVAKITLALLVGAVVGFLVASRASQASQVSGISQERHAVLVSTLFAEGESLNVVREYLVPLGALDPAAFLDRLADRYSKSADRLRQRQAEELRSLALALRQPGEGEKVRPSPVPSEGTPREAIPRQDTPAVTPARGIIKLQPGDSVRLRAEPTTNAPAVALLADGARVEILNVVEGQAIGSGEKRWYKVRSGRWTGYVYFPLVTPE